MTNEVIAPGILGTDEESCVDWKATAEERLKEIERLEFMQKDFHNLDDIQTIRQLHAAVKTAQELAATRLREIERLQKTHAEHVTEIQTLTQQRDDYKADYLRVHRDYMNYRYGGSPPGTPPGRLADEPGELCLVAGCGKPCLVTKDGAVGGLCKEHNGTVIRPRDEGEPCSSLPKERSDRLRKIAGVIESRPVLGHWPSMMAAPDAEFLRSVAAESQETGAPREQSIPHADGPCDFQFEISPPNNRCLNCGWMVANHRSSENR